MIVQGVFNVKGRGTVISVDRSESPDVDAVKVGHVLRNKSGTCWRVTGIERSRGLTGYGPMVGLVLGGPGLLLPGAELRRGPVPVLFGKLPEVPV